MVMRREDGLQKLCFQWLSLARPDVYAFAVPNEGKRSLRTAARMRSMGLRSGVADICIFTPLFGRVGFIELKIRPNKLTPEQEQFRDICRERTIPWAECTSFEQFQGTVNAWCGRRERKVA